MIKDRLENSKFYENIHPLFKKAFNYLKETDFLKMEAGKYPIEGESLFAIIKEYQTKSSEGGKLEAHQKYIDIQYVYFGKELMGHVVLNNHTEIRAYDLENDYALFDLPCSFIPVNEGEFTVFFPQDLHLPSIFNQQEELVKKVVIKILLDY